MRPLRYRVYVKATPEEVWAGITEPGFTERYFHRTAITSSFAPGEPLRYVRDGADMVVGEVVESDPPRRLVTTWRVLYDADLAEEPASRVEWLITPEGAGLTRLDVVHSDLARSPGTWGSVKDGWGWVLDSLKSLLETGEGLPPAEEAPVPDDVAGDWHRTQAVEANNLGWSLVEASGPGVDEEPTLRAARRSCVATPVIAVLGADRARPTG
ncbi:MAG: SRPBCC family protein [Nocardioides sp.]|uniref:SRPBCC family protein n=1 Tax=Nocardioides sp. TaxID=35761 RepID=UPI0039E66FFD